VADPVHEQSCADEVVKGLCGQFNCRSFPWIITEEIPSQSVLAMTIPASVIARSDAVL
jgi:hypothetical protein